MATQEFTDSEKAKRIHWIAKGSEYTAIQKTFRMQYQIEAPARSCIGQWQEEYQTQAGHSHRGGNSRPQISDDKKARIRAMANENPTLSF